MGNRTVSAFGLPAPHMQRIARRGRLSLRNTAHAMNRRIIMQMLRMVFGGMLLIFVMACQSGEAAQRVAPVTLAEQPFKRAEPLIVGVGVHFGIGGNWGYDPDEALKAITRIGFDSTRDDFPWGGFDNDRPPNGLPFRLGAFLPRAVDAGIVPMVIVGHGNPAVEGGKPPVTVAGQDAFAGFTARAAKATARFRPIYEIWNEWNMIDGLDAAMHKREGLPSERRSAANYASLALKAAKALRAAAPKARILVGGTGMDPGWAWAEAVFRSDAMKYADGFSVHLYNHCEPDLTKRTATNAIDQAEDLQRRLHAIAKASVPVYVTEVGWPTTTTSPCPLSREASANNMAQFLFWAAATPWMKGVWLYQLKDQGRNPSDFEDNFGILDYDYRDKPAACMVRAAIAMIKETETWSLQRPMDDIFILTAKRGTSTRVIAWTSRPAIKAQFVPEGGKPVSYRSLCVGSSVGAATVPLGPVPVVIDLGARPAVSGKVILDPEGRQ